MTAPRIFDRLPPEQGIYMQVWAERLLEKLESLVQNFAISGSWTVPSDVLSAADVGSDVTVTILDHTRYFGDGTFVEITGGEITGQGFEETLAVYYDDETRIVTAPDFEITDDIRTAQHNVEPGRTLVGTVVTPANGDPPTTGGTAPPGSGYTPGGDGITIPIP